VSVKRISDSDDSESKEKQLVLEALMKNGSYIKTIQ
jgi:hypothetical protein